MTELVVAGMTIKARDAELVSDASFALRSREFVVLLGPNGAGKTSLIEGSLGIMPRHMGTVRLDGIDMDDLSPIRRARQVSYLPQMRPLAWPNCVRDIVALGRYSYGSSPGRLGKEDANAVDRAIEACELNHLEDRRADTLSGGELARVHCARAFAAETPLLFADEPIAALDPSHQFRVLDLIAAYVEAGGGALVVLHDVQLAARYASRLIWMQDGRIVADGLPEQTLTPARLQDVFGVRAEVNGRYVSVLGTV